MRNRPAPGTPSEAETGGQAATRRRLALEQQLVTAKDHLRTVKAKLDFPTTTEARKKHLRLEWGHWDARRTAIEVQLGRST